MSSFTEIRPLSTEISCHVKCVLTEGQKKTDGQRTDGQTDGRPENITSLPRVVGGSERKRLTTPAVKIILFVDGCIATELKSSSITVQSLANLISRLFSASISLHSMCRLLHQVLISHNCT